MQTEFVDNYRNALLKFVRKHGRAYCKIFLNTWYGVSVDTTGYNYRRMIVIFKDVDMTPLNREASFDSVIEWDCQFFGEVVFNDHYTNEDYIERVHAVWPHNDRFEMFDKVLAPRGFNKNGFPTPTMLDVVTRERCTKEAQRSYMTSKNAQNRALLWEQENDKDE